MQDAGCRMQDSGVWILDSGFWSLDSGFWILDSGFRIQDAGFWIQDSRFWFLDSGFRMQDSGFRIQVQDSGFRILDAGCKHWAQPLANTRTFHFFCSETSKFESKLVFYDKAPSSWRVDMLNLRPFSSETLKSRSSRRLYVFVSSSLIFSKISTFIFFSWSLRLFNVFYTLQGWLLRLDNWSAPMYARKYPLHRTLNPLMT